MSWSIICCEPQRERGLGEALSAAGFSMVVPLYTSWRIRKVERTTRDGRRWEHESRFKLELPLFPRYVFSTIHPDLLYLFKADGAIRALNTGPHLAAATERFLGRVMAEWLTGAFNDPEPASRSPKSQPIGGRNRKTKRRAAQARRSVLGWQAGLFAAKAEMEATECREAA